MEFFVAAEKQKMQTRSQSASLGKRKRTEITADFIIQSLRNFNMEPIVRQIYDYYLDYKIPEWKKIHEKPYAEISYDAIGIIHFFNGIFISQNMTSLHFGGTYWLRTRDAYFNLVHLDTMVSKKLLYLETAL